MSYSKLLIVVKGFWYPFKQHRLSVRKNCYPFERFWLSVRKRNVICLNDSGYLLDKNFIHSNGLGYAIHIYCHPFEQFELSFQINNCQLCYCFIALSPEPFAMFANPSKNVSLNNNILLSIVYHHLMNFHGTFSAK